MAETLLSVGLDVGTSTTQMIVSRLKTENRASGFAVPDFTITEREILYRSPVYMTPLLSESLADGEKIRKIVENEYEKAGITPEQVDTGAVIITGESSRKENARAVIESLSALAGDFVVATAGPDLESILAARGAGAAAFSEQTGKTVLHMDIGGGTSNLALIENGEVTRTGCLNVGGRLVKMDETHRITYISPVLKGLTDLKTGQPVNHEQLETLAELLTKALEMAAGLREPDSLLSRLMTEEVKSIWEPPQKAVLSFSGGVADCMERELPFGAFGDLGPELGQAIRKSRLCAREFMLGTETIRATVIGAGCHSTRLSGSTVFWDRIPLPLQNLPVVKVDERGQTDPDYIRDKLKLWEGERAVLAMPGFFSPSYHQVSRLAECIAAACGDRPVIVCLEADMAKALGQKLRLLLPAGTPCLCIDRLKLTEENFLDVGRPVGPAFPVVIKTLVLSQ